MHTAISASAIAAAAAETVEDKFSEHLFAPTYAAAAAAAAVLWPSISLRKEKTHTKQ